ncbi:hypothetical protein RDI58_012465 [Solanum bulbocastanum]|uniref:Uncharacterized protein n=1 Tax=Solanum bulbocastanum TaxID=147425 RepID=A0AAN8YDN5_SOLBU
MIIGLFLLHLHYKVEIIGPSPIFLTCIYFSLYIVTLTNQKWRMGPKLPSTVGGSNSFIEPVQPGSRRFRKVEPEHWIEGGGISERDKRKHEVSNRETDVEDPTSRGYGSIPPTMSPGNSKIPATELWER